MGFVERLRAASAAEKWASRLRFPGVPVDVANASKKALVSAFVSGWEASATHPLDLSRAFAEFATRFMSAFPVEVRRNPATEAALAGLERAFSAGWTAAERRRFGVEAAT